MLGNQISVGDDWSSSADKACHQDYGGSDWLLGREQAEAIIATLYSSEPIST